MIWIAKCSNCGHHWATCKRGAVLTCIKCGDAVINDSESHKKDWHKKYATGRRECNALHKLAKMINEGY